MTELKVYEVVDKKKDVRLTYSAPETFTNKQDREVLLDVIISNVGSVEDHGQALARVFSDARRQFHTDKRNGFNSEKTVEDRATAQIEKLEESPELMEAVLASLKAKGLVA